MSIKCSVSCAVLVSCTLNTNIIIVLLCMSFWVTSTCYSSSYGFKLYVRVQFFVDILYGLSPSVCRIFLVDYCKKAAIV
jgi:hypothetical protein